MCVFSCWKTSFSYLFAIMSNWRQDSSQGFEAHSNVQQVSSKEEVVVVSKDWHGGVPDQVEKRLQHDHIVISNIQWATGASGGTKEKYSRCL